MAMQINLGARQLDLTTPLVMGIINVTPESFSDGGAYGDAAEAVAAAESMIDAGAAIVDIGGESTRPGAEPVAAKEQLRRVMPVLEKLRRDTDVVVSVDTGDAEVIRETAAAGAEMINDVFGLQQPGALEALADSGVAVCIMHMRGLPTTMQHSPSYTRLPGDIVDYLRDRIAVCAAAGIDRDRIAVDPGFGFGKTDEHNLSVLAGLDQLAELALPLVVGLSRKATLGRITGRAVDRRLAAGLAAAVLAVERGASIVRTHDVPATVDALRIVQAVRAAGLQPREGLPGQRSPRLQADDGTG